MNASLVEKHLKLCSSSFREFNNLITSKPTTLRSDKSKKIYTYFHLSILPLIDTLEPAKYKSICRILSKLYKQKTPKIDETIDGINGFLKDELRTTNHVILANENPVIETEAERSSSPLEPSTPTHKITEQKKAQGTKENKMTKEQIIDVIVKAINNSLN
jgi:hypothetical protein